jgi:DNA-binding beta-propeller fold protein YncE
MGSPIGGSRLSSRVVLVGPDGGVFVAADGNGFGVALQLDPRSLAIRSAVQVGDGPSRGIFDASGHLWLSGVDGPSTLTRIDTGSMDARISRVSDDILGLAIGPGGELIGTLYASASVAVFDDQGREIRTLSGFASFPLGVAIGADGRGFVVAEGPTPTEHAIYFVDFRRMSITSKVAAKSCLDPREGLRLGNQGIISCAALPGLALLDLKAERVVQRIRFGGLMPRGDSIFLQPRGMSILHA